MIDMDDLLKRLRTDDDTVVDRLLNEAAGCIEAQRIEMSRAGIVAIDSFQSQNARIKRLRAANAILLAVLGGLIRASRAALHQADEALLDHHLVRAPAAQASYDNQSAAIKIAVAGIARANEESKL